MLFANAAPPVSYSNLTANSNGYCVTSHDAGTKVTDGIDVGGASGATVKLTGPDSGMQEGHTALPEPQYQFKHWSRRWVDDRVDSGSTHYRRTAPQSRSMGWSMTTPTPMSRLTSCSLPRAASMAALTPRCAPAPHPTRWRVTQRRVQAFPGEWALPKPPRNHHRNGAVIVGAFGTMGGTSSSPLTLTLNFESSDVAISAGNLRLLF